MKVEFHNLTEETVKEVESKIKLVFKSIKNNKNIQIIFVDNEKIKDINRQYRSIDKPTDVLSFPNDDEDDDSLGDVFISLEQAKIQANNYEHSIIREIGFLAVHGYLHLIGYDHETKEDEIIMFKKQEEILSEANLLRKKD